MTEKLSTSIVIPAWLVGTIAVCFIAFMGFLLSTTARANTVAEKVYQNEIKLTKTEATLEKKVDQEDFNRYLRTLERIEDKVDNLQKNK